MWIAAKNKAEAKTRREPCLSRVMTASTSGGKFSQTLSARATAIPNRRARISLKIYVFTTNFINKTEVLLSYLEIYWFQGYANEMTADLHLATLSNPTLIPKGRIGRFVYESEIGQGSVGIVYLFRDPMIGRKVAIKVLNPQLPANQRQLFEKHFIQEARAAGRLNHPNIVTVYDADKTGDLGGSARRLIGAIGLASGGMAGNTPPPWIARLAISPQRVGKSITVGDIHQQKWIKKHFYAAIFKVFNRRNQSLVTGGSSKCRLAARFGD